MRLVELKDKWVKRLHGLQNVKVPRSIAPYFEDIPTIVSHHLMATSSKAVTAQTIAIATQPSGHNKQLQKEDLALQDKNWLHALWGHSNSIYTQY